MNDNLRCPGSGAAPSWRWVPIGALVLALLLGLGGCAAPGGGATTGEGALPRTAADMTDAERRARVRLELATEYFARGQAQTALEELRLVMAAQPDLPEAFNLRGLVLASMGELRAAEDSFRRALELAPRDGDTMHNWAWVMCQHRRHAEADALFARALEQPQYRGVVRTLLARGVCQAREGNLALAERTLSRAYELDPANAATAVNLAEVLLRLGQAERARFYVNRVNAQPDVANAQTLWLAARIEHRLGNAAAVADYGRQLRGRFPQSPEALAFARRQFDD
jgi:type IV pilus assembly protein PilF